MRQQLTYWNGAAWSVIGLTTADPIVGEADRGDTLTDIDRALAPALDPLLRRMLPGRLPREREAVRKEIVEYIADVLGTEQAAP